MRVVRDVTPVIVDDVPIRLLDIGAPQAFSIGLYSPVIVADSAFWRALGKQERRAIAHHENGHVERDDALTLLILRLLAAFCPWPADRARLEAWRRAAERSCDAHAARALDDPLCVAQALVATEQARAAFPRRHRLPELGLGIADCSNLEARVRDLLTETRSVAPLGNDLMGLVIASFGAAILTLAWPGGTVHHAVETVLGLILRL